MGKTAAASSSPVGKNPFWDFSLEVYQRDGVAPSCLSLQDRRGLDVNLLLFCGWAAGQGWVLDAAALGRLTAAVAPWQNDIVIPLRELRRRLKGRTEIPGAAALRERIKEDELQSEAVQQALLFSLLPQGLVAVSGAAVAAVAAGNMIGYLAYRNIVPDTTDTADLAAVLRGCCPALAPLEAVWLLSEAATG